MRVRAEKKAYEDAMRSPRRPSAPSTSTCIAPRATEAYRPPWSGPSARGGRTGRPDLVAAGGRGAGWSSAEESSSPTEDSSSEAEASLQPSVSSPPLRSAVELASPTVDAAAVLRSAAELASSSSDAAVESSEVGGVVGDELLVPYLRASWLSVRGHGSLLLTSYVPLTSFGY